MSNVKIPELPDAATLTGNEVMEMVQAGQSVKVPATFLPSVQFSYLLVTDQPLLPNRRVIKAGAGIIFNDAGPGGNLTIIGSGSAGQPTFWTTYQNLVLAAGVTDNQAVNADVVVMRITADAAGSTLAGIDSTDNNGRMLVLINIAAAGDLTIPNNAGSSSAANRFMNVGGFDVIVPPGGSARYWYDPASLAWRAV